MGLSRRDFLKVATGGAILPSCIGETSAEARDTTPRLPEAKGILYDATLCIGCKACMSACKEFNDMPPDRSSPDSLWDDPKDLSAKTINIVKLYHDGDGQVKDREVNGYSFVRRFCMHCVDPSCISACPASALTKDRDSGLVRYDPNNCIGCRYCQIACPYNIPKFQWDAAFPRIVKCQLCSHLIARGSYPACCHYCPNGASIFGDVRDLRREAARRLSLPAGQPADYPLRRVDSGETVQRLVTPYYQKVYGEKDGGGTQVLMMAGVPFSKLGLPELGNESSASHAETLYHTIYKGMIVPYVILGGLFFLIYNNTRDRELP